MAARVQMLQRVRVLPVFELVGSRTKKSPGGSASKVLAAIALTDGRASRSVIASTLWPETTDKRAQANLRTALWRVQAVDDTLLDLSSGRVGLNEHWAVDLHEMRSLARSLTSPVGEVDLGRVDVPNIIRCLGSDLLIDWYDDWVLGHRERWLQLRLHALEALSSSLTDSGRVALAIDAATCAVTIDPLRESARRALIAAHFADGNLSEALRVHREYTKILRRSLGVSPSPHMATLMEDAFGPVS